MSSTTPIDTTGGKRASASFALLDQALWKQFRSAAEPAVVARAWLALQCRFIAGARCGVLVFGEPDVGPFSPLAHWPDEQAHHTDLEATAERAVVARHTVVRELPGPNGADRCCIAEPLLIDDRMCGVAAIIVGGGVNEMHTPMRQLQWGIGWLEALWRREQSASDAELKERTAKAFDMVAAVLEERHFQDACNSLVTELAVGLDCDQVSVGFIRRNRALIIAVSHMARFGSRMNVIRSIGAAMDEAIDQRAVVLYPPNQDWGYRVTREHADLAAKHRLGAVLTVPMQIHHRLIGALTFERAEDASFFDAATIEMCDAVASVVGPILEEKRLNDRNILVKVHESLVTQLRRLLGPDYFARKLATAAGLLLLGFFALTNGTYRVTSDAVLEGLVQRSVVAPFEGYVASQAARAGEKVSENQLLATLDNRDLTLERLRWSTTHRQRLAEFDRALAETERAEANIIRAQIDQAVAQIELLDEQLARTRIVAPFDGIVVSGDLSQSVGATVERGQELFKIAPLDAYRVILKIDEGEIDEVEIGQRGMLLIASMPEDPFGFTIERITPIAEQDEGRNFFRVEAQLDAVDERIRPGMEGVAKTVVDERLLVRIWTDDLVDWLRLTLWKWLP